MNNIEYDSLLIESSEYVTSIQECSSSVLQRKFNIGYNRAWRIIDQMISIGVISPEIDRKTPNSRRVLSTTVESMYAHLGNHFEILKEDDPNTGSYFKINKLWEFI